MAIFEAILKRFCFREGRQEGLYWEMPEMSPLAPPYTQEPFPGQAGAGCPGVLRLFPQARAQSHGPWGGSWVCLGDGHTGHLLWKSLVLSHSCVPLVHPYLW